MLVAVASRSAAVTRVMRFEAHVVACVALQNEIPRFKTVTNFF